jgi:Helix-turn-helix domain
MSIISNENPLLTRSEAAKYLSVSPGTLAVWQCTGRYNLPYVKIGRKAMYQRSALDSFISRRTVGENQGA